MSDHNERACTQCGSLLHHEDDCPNHPNNLSVHHGTPNPASDTAREAAERIHQQYRSAIKVLFDADPYKNGDNTIRLLTERIQTAIDDSTAALRREVEGLKAERDALRDPKFQHEQEGVYARTLRAEAQLAEATKERDALKSALEHWQHVWKETDCEHDDCMGASDEADKALAAIDAAGGTEG